MYIGLTILVFVGLYKITDALFFSNNKNSKNERLFLETEQEPVNLFPFFDVENDPINILNNNERVFEIKAPFQCCYWKTKNLYLKSVDDKAFQLLFTYISDDRFTREIVVCRKCLQKYFFQEVSVSEKDQLENCTLIPIRKTVDADILNEMDIDSFGGFIRLYKNRDNHEYQWKRKNSATNESNGLISDKRLGKNNGLVEKNSDVKLINVDNSHLMKDCLTPNWNDFFQVNYPRNCRLWRNLNYTSLNVSSFKLIKNYVNNFNYVVSLIKCTDCSQLYIYHYNLYKFFSSQDYSRIDDSEFITFVPIFKPEEINKVRNSNSWEIRMFRPVLRSDWPSGQNKPNIYWSIHDEFV